MTDDRQTLKFGFATPGAFWDLDLDARHALVADIADCGYDLMYLADHVSFRNGHGADGFVEVAALSQMHPTIGVMISIYLLPLRHPLPVARQLASMDRIAPGRMIFGVGIGGEDRHEVEICGVDPRTRGKRANESLSIIRELMTGATVSRSGGLFDIDEARIRPRLSQPIPILIGGRSDAALERTGRYGEGWIGVWCSPERYASALQIVAAAAERAGRLDVPWMHGYQPWVGVADDKATARRLVAQAMEDFYHVPFEKFERYVPYGTPADIAAQLNPYVDAGCRLMNLKIVGANAREEVDAGAEIRALMVQG